MDAYRRAPFSLFNFFLFETKTGFDKKKSFPSSKPSIVIAYDLSWSFMACFVTWNGFVVNQTPEDGNWSGNRCVIGINTCVSTLNKGKRSKHTSSSFIKRGKLREKLFSRKERSNDSGFDKNHIVLDCQEKWVVSRTRGGGGVLVIFLGEEVRASPSYPDPV